MDLRMGIRTAKQMSNQKYFEHTYVGMGGSYVVGVNKYCGPNMFIHFQYIFHINPYPRYSSASCASETYSSLSASCYVFLSIIHQVASPCIPGRAFWSVKPALLWGVYHAILLKSYSHWLHIPFFILTSKCLNTISQSFAFGRDRPQV